MPVKVRHKKPLAEGSLVSRRRPDVREDRRIGPPDVAVVEVVNVFDVDPNHRLDKPVGSDAGSEEFLDGYFSEHVVPDDRLHVVVLLDVARYAVDVV